MVQGVAVVKFRGVQAHLRIKPVKGNQQPGLRDGFKQHIHDVPLIAPVLKFGEGRVEDDLGFLFGHGGHKSEPVHVLHLDIQDDQVHLVKAQERQRAYGVGKGAEDVDTWEYLQPFEQAVYAGLLIIDNNNGPLFHDMIFKSLQ